MRTRRRRSKRRSGVIQLSHTQRKFPESADREKGLVLINIYEARLPLFVGRLRRDDRTLESAAHDQLTEFEPELGKEQKLIRQHKCTQIND